MRFLGIILLAAGLVSGAVILVAGGPIGDMIWNWRGSPLDLGPELFFWGLRGLVVAFVLCVVGTELILETRKRAQSSGTLEGAAAQNEAERSSKDGTDDKTHQDRVRVEP